MEKPFKFVLPSPNFNKNLKDVCKSKPHYLTPSGMSLLPREKQPPPMYGKHGATLPAKLLKTEDVPFKQETLTTNIPEKHYCEACEMEFHSFDDLKRHRAQHEKCPVAGCLYKGHPSVIDKHINALHSSGLFDKFKKLSTPEEIAAWREERRKRYPTLANVLLKQKAKEQRQKRGERLEDKKNRFGKVKDRKRAQPDVQENKATSENKRPRVENSKNSKFNKKRKNKNRQKNLEIQSKVQTTVNYDNDMIENDTELSCCGIAMFRGTSQLKNYKHYNEKKVATTNVLFGLVGMYGSDDQSTDNDSNDEEPESINFQSKVGSLENNCQNQDIENKEAQSSCFNKEHTKGCEYTVEEEQEAYNKTEHFGSMSDNPNDKQEESGMLVSNHTQSSTVGNEPYSQSKSSDDEAPEEAPIQRIIPDLHLEPKQESSPTSLNESKSKCFELKKQKMVVPKRSKKFGLNYRKARLRKQNTLLEKLLESDIRHERNVLLQCVRFVCESEFFNIDQNKNQKI